MIFLRVSTTLLMVLVCVFAVFGQEVPADRNNVSADSERVLESPDLPGARQPVTGKKRRFEFAVQYASLVDGGGERSGFGGRIGYEFATFDGGNYTATAEAEVNFFPGRRFAGPSAGSESRRSGRVLQGLFGAKVGRKFDKFGVFAKARPGFVQYSDGDQNYSGDITTIRFRADSETNAALDLGGVFELYPTKRLITRFDLGNTLVRFKAREMMDFNGMHSIVMGTPLPREVKNNFQFGAGVGFKF